MIVHPTLLTRIARESSDERIHRAEHQALVRAARAERRRHRRAHRGDDR